MKHLLSHRVLTRLHFLQLPDAVNAAILLSAWSAAASDIYISSRFLFFLARRGHAPAFLAHLFRYPRPRQVHSNQSDSDPGDSSEREDSSDELDSSEGADSSDGRVHGYEARRERHLSDASAPSLASASELGGEPVVPREQPTYVMPLASVLVSASVGLLTFLSYNTGSAGTVFSWLVSVASVASLQSWAGMLFTYIRWHQGTVHYERKFKGLDTPEAKEAREQIAQIKKARQWGQPYVSVCLRGLWIFGCV